MATTNGFNGNELYEMTETKYENLLDMVMDNREYYIQILSEEYYELVKHHAWLCLIGLIETACIV